MAHIFAHQVGAGDFHQLAAGQHTDGLQITGHQPRDGGLAGAGIAAEDHVHAHAAGLQAFSLSTLLCLVMILQREDIFFDLLQTDDVVHLGLDGFQAALISGG